MNPFLDGEDTLLQSHQLVELAPLLIQRHERCARLLQRPALGLQFLVVVGLVDFMDVNACEFSDLAQRRDEVVETGRVDAHREMECATPRQARLLLELHESIVGTHEVAHALLVLGKLLTAKGCFRNPLVLLVDRLWSGRASIAFAGLTTCVVAPVELERRGRVAIPGFVLGWMRGVSVPEPQTEEENEPHQNSYDASLELALHGHLRRMQRAQRQCYSSRPCSFQSCCP